MVRSSGEPEAQHHKARRVRRSLPCPPRYHEPARKREHSSIETIAARGCEDIAHGLDERRIFTDIRSLGSHDGTDLSQMDVLHIYEPATPVRP